MEHTVMNVTEHIAMNVTMKVENDLVDFIRREVSPYLYQEVITINAKMIADAINKQIPKSVIDNFGWAKCPVCENPLNVIDRNDYCEKCGNKLNWSDFK